MTLRHCNRCGEDHPILQFHVGTSNTWCKPCNAAYQRERYRKAHPQRVIVVEPTPAPDTHTNAVAQTIRDAEMLALGEEVCRQCPKAHHALEVITGGWRALKGNEAFEVITGGWRALKGNEA